MTTPVARHGLDVAAVRDHFPSLGRAVGGMPIVHLDGPAGTQVPRECIDAITRYLETMNANYGGAFDAALATEALVGEARAAAADFLGAHAPEEVAFGSNMTTITFALSRAIGRELSPGDELVLSRLDHDANIAPWLAVAEERGALVRWLEVEPEDGTLRLDALESVVGERTRIVAVGLASNALGTVNDVGRIVEVAHAYGAIVLVDAVHAAPHLPIDVAGLRVDLLVCSTYKFFGPHLGILYGRRELLERLPAYRTRPQGDALPARWETGTQAYELLAGLLGTFEYLAALGRAFGGASRDADRRTTLHAAMAAIRSRERELIGPMLHGLSSVPGLRVHGITDPDRLAERVPTVAFTIEGVQPGLVSAHLAARAINVWDGHMYAVELMHTLGLDRSGGVVRAGLVHYNTADEVNRLVQALHELA